MSDQPLINGLVHVPASHRNGASNHPARPSYMEMPQPQILDVQGSLPLGQILQRRKGTLLLSAFGGLFAGILFTLLQTPVYRARTLIEIQNLNEDFLNMRSVSPTSQDAGSAPPQADLQTQIGILQSESILEQVIADLHMEQRLPAQQKESRLAAWRKALRLPEAKPDATEDALLRQVAKNLEVNLEGKTRLVEVLYLSPDPKLAADVANAVTTAFIQQNLESHWKTTQQTGDWLTHQMEDVRIKLEKSEQELQAYASSAGLLFTSEKDNVAEEKLRQLQQELSKAQADRVTKQSQYERVSAASPDSLPQLLDDTTLQDYQEKLTELHRQLADLTATLTPLHPSVKKVQAQVATLEAARDNERTNVIRRIQNEFESAQRRERLLTTSYEVQARLVTEQAGKATHYDILKREVVNNRQLYDSMLQHVKEAGIASALHASNVRVVDPARPPVKRYKPNLPLNAVLGLFTGGFLGIALVFLRASADRAIYSPGEASLCLDVPELGVIPSAAAERARSFAYYRHGRSVESKRMEKENRKSPVELATWQRKPSALAESFRSTMASILYIGENGDRPRVIAVTSPGPGEGKTTVASNLALAWTEIGRRVLLIDGDLRRPRLHEIFKVSNEWGLSDLLGGTDSTEGTEALVMGTNFGGLHVLPAGSATANVSYLLHSPRVLELLQRMRSEFDMVIIDTPPMLPMPDARVLGRLVDGVILVVRSARTTKDTVAIASQRLTEDGTRVLGTVLNEWDLRKMSSTYGYCPVYGYGAR
jgi:polysaccharide biosynthesis transport protein